jgi:predicted metal-binding protein
MKTPKTVTLIECGNCRGCYYGGQLKVTLHPGTEREQPDEIYIITRKVAKCPTCKAGDDRTKGGKRTKYEY